MAGYAAVDHLEADKEAFDALFLLSFQHIAADKIAFTELDDPVEAGFERRRGLIDVVAVQAHAGLEAEGVAGAQTDRLNPLGLALG